MPSPPIHTQNLRGKKMRVTFSKIFWLGFHSLQRDGKICSVENLRTKKGESVRDGLKWFIFRSTILTGT